MAGPGNRPTRRISPVTPQPSWFWQAGGTAMPYYCGIGRCIPGNDQRVDHLGESLEHHALLRHGAGTDRWPLHP